MIVYQIPRWNDNHENNKSRALQRCSLAFFPNKMDGLGFVRLMGTEDGAAAYGVFHMILAMCSSQPKPRNGYLTENGTERGAPLGAIDLALKFRRPLEEVQHALDVLSSENIGWLVKRETGALPPECPPSARQVPAECPPSVLERRKEGKKDSLSGAPKPARMERESLKSTEQQRSNGTGAAVALWNEAYAKSAGSDVATVFQAEEAARLEEQLTAGCKGDAETFRRALVLFFGSKKYENKTPLVFLKYAGDITGRAAKALAQEKREAEDRRQREAEEARALAERESRRKAAAAQAQAPAVPGDAAPKPIASILDDVTLPAAAAARAARQADGKAVRS